MTPSQKQAIEQEANRKYNPKEHYSVYTNTKNIRQLFIEGATFGLSLQTSQPDKSHEEIFDKYKQYADFGTHQFEYLNESDALKAMAEVAGLRDKEVRDEYRELGDQIVMLLSVCGQFNIIDSVKYVEILQQQLAAKDKEIELIKKELFKANEDYDKDFEKIKKLERVIRKMDADAVSAEKEIEQLKAKMAEMSSFVNPLKEGWDDP